MVTMNNFYPQQLLSENVYFQIYSSEEHVIDLTFTFIDLQVILKKSNNEKPSAAEGLLNEICVLHSLFRQISVYINGTLEGTSNNF